VIFPAVFHSQPVVPGNGDIGDVFQRFLHKVEPLFRRKDELLERFVINADDQLVHQLGGPAGDINMTIVNGIE
jgi:hypothetical protein